MWENQVGRSRAFWQYFFPKAQTTYPEPLGGVSLDTFYAAINDVRPSFIRVEADEATYNLHIILRFELEQALISGDLKPADVPAAWNEKFKNLFGIAVPDAAHGCLQDIHWSMGGLGYFPTYTLGNLYAAQFMDQARLDLGDLDDDFRRGDFSRLKGWLNSKIHLQGMRYPPRRPVPTPHRQTAESQTANEVSDSKVRRALRGVVDPPPSFRHLANLTYKSKAINVI